MTTKDYLNQISYYNKIIDNKLIEITQYKELSYSISAVVNEERVMSSPDPDKTGCGYVRLEQMEESLDKLIDKYIDVKNKIIEQIEQINNEDYYTVLFLRYVRKFTFEKIANETGWCWRQVHRIHAKALQAFEDKYGSEYL
jgi:DNA-directed RNA polymerase specialized sigma subunit